MKLLTWDGWFLYCNTGSLKTHKPSLPCSVLLSNNYVIVKACSRNIKGSINLAYSKNVNLEVSVRLSVRSLLSFLGKEKSTKCIYFATGRGFIHPPFIFATQSLIILSFALVFIAKVCEHSALTNVMKNPLLIVRVIFRSWSTKILILSSLRR